MIILNIMNKFFLNFFLLLLLIINLSCAKDKKITKNQVKKYTVEQVYSEAYKNFENENYLESIKLFEKVENDYLYSKWAPKAVLIKSFIYYDSSRYVEALTNLQKFKKRYPGNKDIPYVEYMIAICMYEQINLVALSQENSSLAMSQFNKLIKNFPNTKYAEDAKIKIDLINEQLAGKEMYLARYYIQKKKWLPAIYRLNNVVKNYSSTVYIEEALHRLVEINYNLGNLENAKKYAAILGYNYNDGDWYKKSYNIVERKNISIHQEKNKKSIKDKILELIKLK